VGDALERGRAAYEGRAWAQAYAELNSASATEPLGVDDLERLAASAYLSGRSDDARRAWSDAHQASERDGDVCRAVRNAFWIAFASLNDGDIALASGWVERAQRILDDADLDCVEHGYLQYPVALRSAFEGDASAAHAGFAQAAKIGSRFGDAELTALARIGEGRCLIFLGELTEGIARIDEAMVAVGAGEVSPIAVGDSYCVAIEACQDLFDLRRAQQWTAALSHWCESQPELVLYRGQCLVHRAEIMHLHGEWDDAEEESERACARLAEAANPMVAGRALYLRGELCRLRGAYAEAEENYRAANEAGRDPQPGLALLRRAQGRLDAAAASIRRALDEAQDPATRARLLAAFVDIALAAGDADAAGVAAGELTAIAEVLDAPMVRAAAEQRAGAVALSAGDGREALRLLRHAWTVWRDLDAPYEAATARMLIGQACALLGDSDGSEMEREAARAAFAALGAVEVGPRQPAGGLTAREVEVVALVAQGKTNRAIADELIVSEKTVASHLSHIFTKLGISSRAALTAFAYENDLL
jgi:DNA-binding CsgD family transcriptional regulator